MNPKVQVRILTGAALFTLAGCSGTTSSTHPSLKPPTPPPTSPKAVVPAGPYAVVVTNSQENGTSYSVLLINGSGTVVAQTTAKLPHLQPGETVMPPLAGASNTHAYYRDGDTDIRSLSPGSTTSLVKTIPAGTSKILGFSVSPDDSQIAVSLMAQATDITKDTGLGWVENLTNSGGHMQLWSNTGGDALRWPVGWHAGSIVDAIGGCGGYAGGPTLACSYHVISVANGNRIATLCETPQSATQEQVNSYYTPSGVPTQAGVACVENQYDSSTNNSTVTLTDVDLTGTEHDVVAYPNQISFGNCFISPDGLTNACQDTGSDALELVSHGNAPDNLGRKYTPLGWLDSSHLLVDVDSTHLGVLTVADGSVAPIPLEKADQMAMVASLPGAL